MAALETRACKQCLLRDADPKGYYRHVLYYRQSLPAKQRCGDALYEERLALCRACKELEGATCRQCGCYVEMRAAALPMACPISLW